MKHFLIFAVVLLVISTVIWFVPTPLPITARIIGRTNIAGVLHFLVTITNQTAVNVHGAISADLIDDDGGKWTTAFGTDNRRCYYFTFRPGEGGLFACTVEKPSREKLLVTYCRQSKITAFVTKWRNLRNYKPKDGRDAIPNARTLTLEVPPP